MALIGASVRDPRVAYLTGGVQGWEGL